MHKGVIIAGAFAAVVVIGGITYLNASQKSEADRRQRDTDAQIADLRQRLEHPAGAPASAASSLGDATTQGAPYLQLKRLTSQVLEEGYKRLTTRDPKQVEEAVRIFQEGIEKIDSKNPQFYSGLGRSQLVLGHNEDALAAFQAGEKLDPHIPELISGQGWALFNLKRYGAARDKWEQALKLDPKSLDANSALAWVYLGLGERDKSLAAFNILIFSGSDREDWKIGRTMAAAGNTNLPQIRVYFPVPEPSAYTASATEPATQGK